MIVAGVDGCRGGWVVASAGLGGPPTVEVVLTFSEIVARDYTVIGVDMPIGLAADGARPADTEARAVLGPRKSSLFSTPAFDVVDSVAYPEALALSRTRTGKGLSKQAFNLLPMIRQVRAIADDRCYEVHPETSFVVMAGAPMTHPKRVYMGVQERTAALADVGLWPANGSAIGASPDDVLDALAALWTARRIATGTARVFGDPTARDPTKFPLTIHA